ncbi:aberrant pollen transmission1 [Corchorus olitorius]|uniref:Aberrant pollen transmission1 n=1 Tax=Corchorus olitorius TaxID=93759 RepID=A0A1R3K2R4_9ROSI|nr:aberrant pollen transmission1 [Corchorus olitorius]
MQGEARIRKKSDIGAAQSEMNFYALRHNPIFRLNLTNIAFIIRNPPKAKVKNTMKCLTLSIREPDKEQSFG